MTGVSINKWYPNFPNEYLDLYENYWKFAKVDEIYNNEYLKKISYLLNKFENGINAWWINQKTKIVDSVLFIFCR